MLLEYTAAVTDDSPEQRPVPFNLTNHTYFQLAGANSGPRSVEDHTLEMTAEKFVHMTLDLEPPPSQAHSFFSAFSFSISVPAESWSCEKTAHLRASSEM